MVTVATGSRCRHCRGTLFFTDDDGQVYCAVCYRPYKTWADYGRIGGLQTVLRHGREWLREIGRRGGLARRLPTISEVRQQTAPEVQYQLKGGIRLPNRLSELKELWKEKRGEFSCN